MHVLIMREYMLFSAIDHVRTCTLFTTGQTEEDIYGSWYPMHTLRWVVYGDKGVWFRTMAESETKSWRMERYLLLLLLFEAKVNFLLVISKIMSYSSGYFKGKNPLNPSGLTKSIMRIIFFDKSFSIVIAITRKPWGRYFLSRS